MKRPASIKVLEIIGLIMIVCALIISIYDYTQYVIPCNPGGEKYSNGRGECAANGLAILFFGVPLSIIALIIIGTCELIFHIKYKKIEYTR